jgi:hypothetical protein
VRSAIVGVFLLLGSSAMAQEETAPPPPPWNHTLVGGFTITQIALKDWSQGGEDALAWTLTLDGKSAYDQEKYNWENTYKLAFGQTKLGSQGVRKTDDKINLSSTLIYKIGTLVNPYVGATFKTQFAKGFNYTDVGKVALSQFLDPAYLTQSAGVGFQPREEFKTRLGLALREIITRDFNGFTDDPKTAKIEKSDIDGGLESVSDVSWKLMEDVLYTSKLEIFMPFSDVGATSFNLDNKVAMKVNKYITANINLQIIDDETASKKTQVKEALAIGLSYSFL